MIPASARVHRPIVEFGTYSTTARTAFMPDSVRLPVIYFAAMRDPTCLVDAVERTRISYSTVGRPQKKSAEHS